jgi:nitroreductase
VAVVLGGAKDELSRLICAKFDRGVSEPRPYQYAPDPLPDGFLQRARECGHGIFKAKGIDRKDRAARRAHDRENYVFFGAPAALFFHLPKNAERGNFLDMGFFMQNVMLGFLSLGVSTCPQASFLDYAETVTDFLGLPDRLLVAGMSAGYADDSAPVNAFVPPRLPAAEYVAWYE